MTVFPSQKKQKCEADMRLVCWAAAQRLLLLVLVLETFLHVRAEQHQTRERHYYIAAVELDWKYWDSDAHRFGPAYKKVVFREYDEGFRQAKTHPTWLGLLGPTLRAEEGETIVVTFRNMATGAHSLHPHGVAYGKQSEGAHYFDNTSQKEKEDDIVQPGGEHVYYWEVTSAVAPQKSDPACLTYTYVSHQDVVQDYNSGLIGTLLICKRGSLDEDRKQINVHHEYVFLFGIFDEKESRYKVASGYATDDHVKHTINGYTHGSLPDVSVCAHASVSIHLVAMSSEAEVFSVHMNGQVLQQNGRKMSSVGLISGSTATAGMVAVHPGRWMLSSHTSKHIEAGMHAFVDVKSCDDFEAPRRRMTIAQRRESRQWKYFIAAEEILWDYAPNMPEHIDEDFKHLYLKQSPTRIGQRYKKAVYTMYKNESFTERMETKQRKNELGILGPVIRAQIRDVITIVFKNMASRPYSIYPHGLTIEKSEEGVNYPEGGNHSHGVQPGETYTYVWRVVEEDEPLEGDSRCLTRMYHSAVDTPRDIASGLIGPILICKSQSLNVRNVQLKADKEQHAMFAVFDENKSWYLDYNIRRFSDPTKVNKANSDFYKSNVMHTINGYAFESGELLGFCKGEIATWHLSSVGAQDYIQTATFYGHPFELNERTEDFLSLYPMTGETITMAMDNIGVWLMASLNSHETTKGMRLKFQDVECFRDSVYEYDDEPATVIEFTVWKPPTLEDIMKEDQATPEPETKAKGAKTSIDDYTDKWAEQWGIRSLKSQSVDSDMEKLDLSFLDYDAVDVPDGDTNLKTQNKTFSNLMEVDSINVTVVNLQHRSMSENTTQIHTATSASNSSMIITENTTDSNKMFDTKNTTAHNATASSPAGNVSREMTNFMLSKQEATNVTLPKQEATNVTLSKQKGHQYLRYQNKKPPMLHYQNKSHQSPIFTIKGHQCYDAKQSHQYSLPNKATNVAIRNKKPPMPNVTIKATKINAIPQNKPPIFRYGKGANNVALPKQGAPMLRYRNKKPIFTIPKKPPMLRYRNKGHQCSIKQKATNVTIPKKEATNVTIQKQEATNVTIPKQGATNVTLPKQGATNVTIPKQEPTNLTLPKQEPTNVTVNLQGIANVTVLSAGNATSHLETDKINGTVTGDNQTSVDTTMTEDSEERLTRGDVFSYSPPLSNYSTSTPNNLTEGNVSVSTSAIKHVNVSANATNHSLSMPEIRGINRTSRYNLTILEVEKKDNITSENITAPAESFSNTTLDLFNLTVSSSGVNTESSEELSSLESREEVLIYLKENNTEVIKTTSAKIQGYNWTYDGTHQMEPMEIPDHMVKYFEKQALQTTPAPKRKLKKVNLRHKPQIGEGMKTRRRKVYKPQVRSGLPFSPRGFNPAMTPRGARPSVPQPVSDEDELINVPVVIGVPRPDFSDYELYVPGDEPSHLGLDEEDLKANEYEYVTFKDPYSSHEDLKGLSLDETTKYYLKDLGPNVKTYYISAEEVEWDYAGYGQKRQDKMQQNTQKTSFTKVVFRGYMDSSFRTPDIRGEMNEHLGILGPVIKAEVGQSIMVVFRNNANRPYSVHPNGVAYTKRTEGLSYEDGSTYWYKFDDEVQPNTTFTYLWKVDAKVGPLPDESDCRTWAYYSGVNPEKDIHSGLIGPLLVCRKGTLDRNLPDVREFMLLFMTFDESQSWYFEQNIEIMRRKSRRRIMVPRAEDDYKFHSINGIIYNLKGLRMYTNQLARWHLINMGGPKDFHSVHFHGQTFLHKQTTSYRQAVFPLLPGTFATLEMYPSRPGLWQLETEVGFNQKKGMQTLFLVLDNDCYHPLGLQSGSVKDDQITAINTRGYWEPHLARLNNLGKYNAWSTDQKHSWIQVDFQRPVVISQVATQGAKQLFSYQYVVQYLISYSTDRRKWIFYKGDSKDLRKVFTGNRESYETKKNTFFPPIIARFVRLHPTDWYNKATVRMEFYGCELDGCSVPLGIENGLIEDHRITASSAASSWYSGPWKPSLARLNAQGSVNAWQAKHSDRNQWLQVELPHVQKITGIITQGAKSLGKEMYVMSYSLQYSDDNAHWNQYTDDDELPFKTFPGNTDNNMHVKNYIYPPIFSRFIRIKPISWMNSITMRIELLGCEFE
ncbi:coagulation factor V [Solea senegalensis]|uniref:ferroxidase n=1 Tax=Solea senegalensis TaxID=28829 RepID=A0AAV6PLV6_SOLSE|nr:coagulation factor V [Solea senegalensis]